MSRRIWLVFAALVVASVLAIDLTSPAAEAPSAAAKLSHHLRRGFQNTDPGYTYTVSGRAAKLLARTFEGWPARGKPLAAVSNDGAELRANGVAPTVTWIGHSTFLVQLAGVNILIISHDHYDHLDAGTVERLARDHAATFFVPLGLRAWLLDHGARDVVELDWWEGRDFRGLRFTCTPAQHSSGRTLTDQNLRLWGSWVIAAPQHRLFFAGDSGYYAGFKEIGQRLGPFDLAAIPIGGYSAYDRRHPNHVNPEEALQVLEDVRAKLMVPMHWGTFELNREPFREPPERLLREAVRRGLEERIALLSPGQSIHW